MIRIKRAYEPAGRSDGKRILVDRLWPRGIKRERLKVDEWMKGLSPSDALRAWFGHTAERWDDFRRRYRAELTGAEQRALLERLARFSRDGAVTLLYGARDAAHNQAVVLSEVLAEDYDCDVAGVPLTVGASSAKE